MRSHRMGFLVAAAVVAVTVAGFAWSEKASSGNRHTSKVSGQCPMSGGGGAVSCPYLRGDAGAGTDVRSNAGSGCTRLEKDARAEAGTGTGMCPRSGNSGKSGTGRAGGAVKAALRNV